MLNDTRLTGATISLGFLSTTAQIVALRELLVTFTGNELTVATTLALWLLCVAAGSLLLRRLLDPEEPRPVAFLGIIAGLAAVVQVVLLRLLQPLAAAPGEILSPLWMAVLSLAGIMPSALALGGLFVGLVGLAGKRGNAAPVARTYGIEAIGSALAGLLLSVFLLEKTNAFMALGLAGLVSTLSAFILLGQGPNRRRAAGNIISLAAVACFGAVMVWSGDLELATRRLQWGGLEVVESVDSRYGSIVVTRRGAIHDFFQSGALAHTIPDPLAAEESVHIPLLYHPDPEKVLIIGGAGSGVVSETVRHPSVTALDIVELDPEVLEITRRYAPDDWMESSRVAVHPIYGDGRAYVASTGRTYDVVIVNVGMPASLQVNRYYTLEFFRQVNRVLEPGGILALALPSPGSFISPEVASLVASVVRSVRQVFARVDILPGDTIHIIASRDLDLRQRSQVMIETMQARDLNTSYVNQYRLWERLVPLERARIDSLVAKYSSVPANTDYRPVSASFAIDRWARHFASGRLLSELAARVNVGSSVAFIVLAGLVVSALIMLLTRSSVTAFPAALMVYSVGVTTMFSQILIVLCFQIVSGFMYGRIAGLVAAFMLGMGLASTLAGRGNVRRRHGLLLAFQIMLAALPLIVVGAFKVVGESVLATTAVPEIVFPCLALFGGAVGGTVFAGGSGWISEAHSEVAEAGAAAYSIDLLGAAGAGFAAGLLAIPAMGLAGSAYAVSTANLILLVPALIGRRAHRKSLPH